MSVSAPAAGSEDRGAFSAGAPVPARGDDGGLPAPCVLVVGDFRDGDTFASRAWEKVCEAYDDQPPDVSFGPPPAPPPGLSLAPEALPPLRAVPRSCCPNPYPVPFSDVGHARREDVRRLLYRYLSTFDTCAIVACGTAANTSGLLSALGPLQIPVLVTVDSTMEKLRPDGTVIPRRGNVLRLMPNNEQQAQAIIAKVSALAGHGAGAQAEVFCYPDGDAYVYDLRKALEGQTKEGPGRPRLRFTSDIGDLEADPRDGIVVCAGYHNAFAKLLQGGKTGRHTILSDGCYGERAVHAVAEAPAGTDFYWARPAFDAAEYAYDAYRGVCAVWQHLIEQRHVIRERPRESLRPFVSLLRDHLQRRRSSHYRFRGTENQRGGYLLEPVRGAPVSAD